MDKKGKTGESGGACLRSNQS